MKSSLALNGILSGIGNWVAIVLVVMTGTAKSVEPSFRRAHEERATNKSIIEYAKRCNLPPAQTLDLGSGVALDLVLIPAARTTIGTPRPKPLWFGLLIMSASSLLALFLVVMPAIRAIQTKRRFQIGLGRCLSIAIAVSLFQYGFFCFRQASATANQFVDGWDAHDVIISRPFFISRYEVTQAQYLQIMGSNPSFFRGSDLPVEQVSWDDSQVFCEKASSLLGFSIRLPSEAEWEHACRSGTDSVYYSGTDEAALGRVGWYRQNSNFTTHAVGQKLPSQWGLFDSHGNIAEWCSDFYAQYDQAAETDPRGPSVGCYRVHRGGSWISDPSYCRSGFRSWCMPNERHSFIGFRVVVPAAPVEDQRAAPLWEDR